MLSCSLLRGKIRLHRDFDQCTWHAESKIVHFIGEKTANDEFSSFYNLFFGVFDDESQSLTKMQRRDSVTIAIFRLFCQARPFLDKKRSRGTMNGTVLLIATIGH
jgi:hypothetical protein